MKQFIQIALPSGHVYEVPVAVVANHRAKTMLERWTDEFVNIESAMADTVDLFKGDLNEVREWFFSEMNPGDIEADASLVRFTPPETPWGKGEWSYHDHRSIVGELDGEGIMKSPVEYVATVMAEARQLCNVTVLNAQDGQPFGAVAVIMGGPKVVDAYIAALQATGDQITGNAPGAITH